VGQFIFETDTLLSKYWSGSAWSNFVGGVSSLTAGTGVSVSSTTGAVTASIGQSVATSASPTFSNVNLTAPSAGLTIGSWSSGATAWGAVEGNRGYLLLHNTASDSSIYLRTKTDAGNVNIGSNNSNTLLVGDGFATVNGSFTISSTLAVAGQINSPNQYCYNGDNTGGVAISYSGTPVIPPNTYFNVGSAFNTGNGRFTVPIAGYVLCSFNSLITRNLNASHAYVHFAVNGVRKSVVTHTVYDLGGNYQSLNNTAIVYCPANSYVTAVFTTPQASAYGGEYGLGLTYRFLG
jgi:hypothetical protein